jgi:hypothetical protein
MATKNRNSTLSTAKGIKGKVTVNKNMPHYDQHPFFVKKAEDAKELLSKVGLPKQLSGKISL